ncbi:MAG: DUF4424 family protein, partial [Bacteroidetes bacterium]|nr:DUF4424 family protein [Bacteroidota bacterium]
FENYIIVPIEIKPYSKKNIIISYSQKIIDSSAVYILTTTKSWNLPLKKVKYIIETINDYPKVFISLTPNKIKRTKYKSIYVIKKRNFMPSEDLYICVHRCPVKIFLIL